MPTLERVELSPEWTNKPAPELDETTLWYLDGRRYEIPRHVRTVIETACDKTVEGLISFREVSERHFRWFNRFLRTRHRIYIEHIRKESDTGKAMVRIATDGNCSERRLCRFDSKRWTLGETLQWALNERDATYKWTLDFWRRDFVLKR